MRERESESESERESERARERERERQRERESGSMSICFECVYIYACTDIYFGSDRHCFFIHGKMWVPAREQNEWIGSSRYGVATISRLLKIIGLFCGILSLS